jgi:hypothetical protein
MRCLPSSWRIQSSAAEWERTALARTVANALIRYRIERKLSQRGLNDAALQLEGRQNKRLPCCRSQISPRQRHQRVTRHRPASVEQPLAFFLLVEPFGDEPLEQRLVADPFAGG